MHRLVTCQQICIETKGHSFVPPWKAIPLAAKSAKERTFNDKYPCTMYMHLPSVKCFPLENAIYFYGLNMYRNKRMNLDEKSICDN